MNKEKSCGVLCFRSQPHLAFLLLKHSKRWDLPKGHIEPGEDELACALRELQEEAGIKSDQISIDQNFRFETTYQLQPDLEKTYVIFIGELKSDTTIIVEEHADYQWFRWQPPHSIQEWLIDPVLKAAAPHIRTS